MSRLEGRNVSVESDFLAPTHPAAIDLSGIASAASRGSRRRCLVINNEGTYAQFATFKRKARTLEAGKTVALLPPEGEPLLAVGRAPELAGDDGSGKYMLDGEAVCWLDPYYYVTGSHSLADPGKAEGRSTFRPTSYIVARVTANGTRPELSYRLNEVLAAESPLRPSYLTTVDGGLNIEGLAGRNGRLYFGLRSPVLNGKATVVSVRAAALFTSGATLAPESFTIALGKNTGIRDLVAFGKRRFLILAGPAGDDGEHFSIRLFDPRDNSVVSLGDLPSDRDRRPEGMLLVRRDRRDGADDVELLVLHDHAPNGDPRLYKTTIPD